MSLAFARNNIQLTHHYPSLLGHHWLLVHGQ